MPKKTFTKSDLLFALCKHVGADSGIKVEQLLLEATKQYPQGKDSAGERRIRQLIVELRLEGHQICALPEKGYFIAQNTNELNQTCEMLNARAMTTLRQTAAMLTQSIPDMIYAHETQRVFGNTRNNKEPL